MQSIPYLGKRVFYTPARDRAQDLCFCSFGCVPGKIEIVDEFPTKMNILIISMKSSSVSCIFVF
jgi:hypothetical protein